MRTIKICCLLALFFISINKGFASSSFEIKDTSKLKTYFENRTIKALSNNLAEDNPLYSRILEQFGNTYQGIGARQVSSVQEGRDLYVWGGMNHIGLKYSKSFVDFSVELNRVLAPDLFDDKRWLVTDTFTIYIDASKILSNLADAEVIDITKEQYAAYAGMTFKRVYKHAHFANSYEEGLGFNLEKLFFSFKNFRGKSYLDLEPYEFLTKEDSLSINVGAVGNIPIYGPLSASAGVMAKYQRMAKIGIQSLGPDDPKSEGESVRLSYEKEKSFSVGASAGLVIDFMNLLRISLLSFDFEYELTDSYKINLSFSEDDKKDLRENSQISKEVERVLKAKAPDLNILEPYLVSEEKRKIETKKSKYSLLLLGGQREEQTSHIQIAKDGKLITFFRHNFERIKYKKNLFSKLLGILIKSFLKLDSFVTDRVVDSKKLIFEYDNSQNLFKSKKDLILDETREKLTLNFKQYYYTHKSKGWIHKKKKSFALNLLNHYSGVDPLIIDKLEDDILVAPLRIEANFNLNKGGVDYFNGLTLNSVYDKIEQACRYESKGKWKFFRTLFGGCKRKIQNAYDKYYKELTTKDYTNSTYKMCKKKVRRKFGKRRRRKLMSACMMKVSRKSDSEIRSEIPLWRLKSFFQELYSKSKHKQDMYNFFGLKNVYLHGSFEAQDRNGVPFLAYFREGEFKGTGLVNNFLRAEQIRSPAAIIVED